MATVKAPVNGELLAWARIEHGLSIEEAARSLNVKIEKLELWEQGDALPTLNQLRNLANLYQRTPASFMLRDTPTGDGHRRPTDFRSFSGEAPDFGRALAREVARARDRRRHLMQVQEPAHNLLPDLRDVMSEPEAAAQQIRAQMNVSVERQASLRNANAALEVWIGCVEALGIVVFQMSRVSPEVCRGFSLYEDIWPIVVLNGAEGVGARQFTLFHEMAHVLSRTSAVCDVWHERGIEAMCNAFAAEVLMPRPALKALAQRGSPLTHGEVANYFKVSQSAAAVRLRTLGMLSQHDLDELLAQAREAAIAQREAAKAKERQGGPSPHLLKVRNLGPRFVTAVLDAMHEERISALEAAQILESKVQALDKLEAQVSRRAAAS